MTFWRNSSNIPAINQESEWSDPLMQSMKATSLWVELKAAWDRGLLTEDERDCTFKAGTKRSVAMFQKEEQKFAEESATDHKDVERSDSESTAVPSDDELDGVGRHACLRERHG